MLRQNFKRADNLDFELVKAGRHTLIWKVLKDGKTKRFEVWNIFRCAFGAEDFDESDNWTFASFESAEQYFNKHENED